QIHIALFKAVMYVAFFHKIHCTYTGIKGFLTVYNDALRYRYMITEQADLISTASSSEVSTSCKRTVPTRLDGRSPAGSNAFDGSLLGWPSASALCTTHSAFFGHPEVIPERDIRFVSA